MCEGLRQPIANQLNMQKIMVLIFLTMKTTIFDTHCSNLVLDDGITMSYAQACLESNKNLLVFCFLKFTHFNCICDGEVDYRSNQKYQP